MLISIFSPHNDLFGKTADCTSNHCFSRNQYISNRTGGIFNEFHRNFKTAIFHNKLIYDMQRWPWMVEISMIFNVGQCEPQLTVEPIVPLPVICDAMSPMLNQRYAYAVNKKPTLIARFMGPTWDPSGADRTQVGPMLAPWTLLSGNCSTRN